MKEERKNPDDRMVCLSIATYSGSKPVSVREFSLINHVLPTFLETTKEVDGPDSR